MTHSLFSPSASGPADLLIISFEGFGESVMHDQADIRLIDPHAKGDGGNDNIDLIVGKKVLRHSSFVGLQAGMVSSGAKTM